MRRSSKLAGTNATEFKISRAYQTGEVSVHGQVASVTTRFLTVEQNLRKEDSAVGW